ncbi:hypothetical protein N0V93_005918 [Gnomoniopsis smithogilvyi]|uniref:Nephrocystin 3-like N-terminal domain-containing protein n=1 Tax=Gnomoniopsis smithogilvyi TaxID=1191159 RepID=A0A9W8YVB8_9PEZI|nr:hypothetical protein N0V93_005918 [Gnomoniopsis smithogilvyi]
METHGPPSRIHLRSPADDFVDTRLPQYHPVFVDPAADFNGGIASGSHPTDSNLDTSFMFTLARRGRSATAPIDGSRAQKSLGPSPAVQVSQSAQMTARPLPPKIEAMVFWKVVWPKAMACLRQTKETPDRLRREFSIRKAETWKNIEEVLTRARDEYDHVGRKDGMRRRLFGKMKKRGRDFGDHVAEPIKRLTKLVPDNEIAAPVLGAVNLLLTAWQEAIKAGKEVSASFDSEQLGDLFATIEFHVGMFQDDQNIVQASVRLISTVFKAVEGAVGFYISWQASRMGQAIFQGEAYLHTLRNSLKQIRTDEEQLAAEAKKSRDWNLDKKMDAVQQELSILRKTGRNTVYVLLADHEAERRIWTKALLEAKNLNGPEVVSIYSKESESPTPEPSTVCTAQILTELLGSTDVDEDDIEAVSDLVGTFDEEDRARAEQIVDTSAFREWMVARGPSKLLIHGDYDNADYPEVSPLSGLCADLVQTVRTRPDFVGLVYFCGRHFNPRWDNNAGPRGLLRSLIVQILQQCPSACPDTLDADMSLGEIEDGDFEILLRLFTVVACRLPVSKTLVVLIDGVQLYEQSRFQVGLHQFVDELIELADDQGPMQSTLKIFMSSPIQTRTKEIYRAFSRGRAILEMGTMQDTGQGLNRDGVIDAMMRGLDSLSDEDWEA